jgi:hypothetical protein
MWEEPWIRDLLAQLPICRYESLNLPTLDNPGRLGRTIQRLVPKPWRPAHRMLRRVITPHDFSIYIYNTWILDHALRRHLSGLMSRFKHVGIVSVDEPTSDSTDIYDDVAFAVRIGFNAAKFRGSSNVLAVPLGLPKTFVHLDCSTKIVGRRLCWSFLGEVKNVTRQAMLTQMSRVKGSNFVHTIDTWDGANSIRGREYSNILGESIFVPSPPGNFHSECYRTYEALACGAIPVVDTSYYREEFRAPFPVVQSTWEDAPEMLNRLLEDADALETVSRKCQTWWRSVKTSYPEKVRLLEQAGRARR